MLADASGELKATREHDALRHVVKHGEIQKYPEMLLSSAIH